ncbi:hypothetical protein OS493_013908 [Desmophyllum pertusum]|uniref:VWFA domain-containing protein n=1 Tax=Desmophyllum pertusum TaxID=174260 RepID=A0A9X0D3F7_9CNID|nr:hypothetical protein OS493_013908 [Desmophyllum pertusum]
MRKISATSVYKCRPVISTRARRRCGGSLCGGYAVSYTSRAMIVLWHCAVIAVFLAPSHATSSDSENQSSLDISLVIDRTTSIGAANYDAMLDSIMTLISKYDVGENKTHFAIVTYAFNAEVRVSLDDVKYHSQEALREGIEEMKAKDKLIHRTRTDKALKKVCDEVFVPEKGDRPESPNVLILFTDGGTRKTSAPYGTVLPACEVKHVHRVAVGIGKNIKRSELEIIAGDSGRVVAVKRFADLPNYLDSIRETANSKSFFILSF